MSLHLYPKLELEDLHTKPGVDPAMVRNQQLLVLDTTGRIVARGPLLSIMETERCADADPIFQIAYVPIAMSKGDHWHVMEDATYCGWHSPTGKQRKKARKKNRAQRKAMKRNRGVAATTAE